MFLDNGSRTIDEFQFFSATYQYNPPIKSIECNWVKREAVEETVGKYIKSTDLNLIENSIYTYGEELNLNPYQTVRADIITSLENILTVMHKPGVKIDIPLQGSLPVPGERVSWLNESLRVPTNCYIRCRNIRYDPLNDTLSIEGEGGISAA